MTRDPKACSHALLDVLSAAIADEVNDDTYSARVDHLFDEISDDPKLLFGTWWALAHGHAIFARRLLGITDDGNDAAYLEFIDSSDPANPYGARDPQTIPIPMRIAGQFLTAGVNDDVETAQALLMAIKDPDEMREFCRIVWDATLAGGRTWWNSIQEAKRA